MLQQTIASTAQIGVINNIAKIGLGVFNPTYIVGKADETSDAIVLRSAKLATGDYPSLYAIARAGAGVNNIDGGVFDAANARGICIFNAPGANARSVAELVMTMIGANARRVFDAISFCRSLSRFDAERTERTIEEKKTEYLGYELASKTLGVIGLGKVGVQVVNLAVQSGMQVIGFDTFLTVANALKLTNDPKLTVAKSMDQVLREADIITVHVDLNRKTRNIIGANQIAQMKKGVTLVNYARSGIYDDDAVIEALETEQVAGYLSDFASPKLIHQRIFTTPHIGASTPESEDRCASMACQQLKDYIEFGTVVNSVNFPTVDVPLHPETRTRITIVNKDVPGMIASYTRVLAEAGFNIPSVPGDSNGKIGYFVIDVLDEVNGNVLDTIRAIEGVVRVRPIRIAR